MVLPFQVGSVASLSLLFFPGQKSRCSSPNITNAQFEHKKLSNMTYLEILLESAAALPVVAKLLFGGRGLVSDLLQLLEKL